MVGVALEVIHVICAREVRLRHGAGHHVEEARMAVRVDDAGHHGLAGEIDALCSGRNGEGALAANLGDAVAFDHKGGVFDRRTAIAGDQACAFEHSDGWRLCGDW
jgi:hypothetical protein